MTLKLFNQPWDKVPICVIDFETTGPTLADRPCAVGLVRFEDGLYSLTGARVNPGIPITPEATAVHGITNGDVAGCQTLAEFFSRDHIRGMLDGAQLCAYNASFDKAMAPTDGSCGDPSWPWLDPLVMVREVDKYASGKGRHTLASACTRHGVQLSKAHAAENDALATGQLLYKLVPQCFHSTQRTITLGNLLFAQQQAAASQWYDFQEWLAKQPPKP